ncbi:uncharacterized protein LOC118489676 [Helianthus annuus]|uniref:uncharacterized protein LOC118484239 n=1 Tax=Helianthus annuus TaxID=4232 RepID=UPI001652C5B3|nr:uncharacterized protein LOC118484239 [Helianthus annuus]XP_035843094.1 uncharacterized protein LOC118489676 [Helianthus annuus]
MEKYREKKRDLHMVFIDLEKAYDSVPRRLIWDSWESRGVSGKYIDLIKDMYVRTKITVRAPVGDTDSFPVEEALPWCLLFADDIVLVADSKQSLNVSGVDNDEDFQITIDGQVVPQVNKFKWRAATGVLCDKRFPTKLKGKFYRVAIRPAMLYGTDCWAIKEVQARKMEVAEMRMLRWMCGHTRLDRIRNDVFRERLEVASISDKIKEGRLRCFGHVKRRQTIEPVRVVENLEVEGRRSRGRPKITWDERIRQDLQKLHLSENMVHDRSSWRYRIKVKDF